jgi:hypothetical protein
LTPCIAISSNAFRLKPTKTVFLIVLKFTVRNNNNNNYRTQVLSQTTFRYHHRLAHRMDRSTLIRPSLSSYHDEGGCKLFRNTCIQPPGYTVSQPTKITIINPHMRGGLCPSSYWSPHIGGFPRTTMQIPTLRQEPRQRSQ